MNTITAAASDTGWVTVCLIEDLIPERGVAALVNDEQVALFRLIDDSFFAVQQQDPYSRAFVMSRGIVGTRGDNVTVASPMFKHVFDLRSGLCLDPMGAEVRHLQTWATNITEEGRVLVATVPKLQVDAP